jgi:hypothetical protein
MTLLDILGVASGGGIFGILGSIAKGVLELKQRASLREDKKLDQAHELALVKLKIDQGTIEGETKAFTSSQESGAADNDSLTAVASLAQTPFQRGVLVWVAAARYSTRTVLTWGSHLLAAGVFFTLDAEMQKMVLMSVFAMASTYGGWWFGSRAVFRFAK